jgi:glycosyltransferase involved in cell wall biosynthesis
MSDDQRPVALVTNTVPDYRREPFRLLDEAEGIEVIAWADDDHGQRAAVKRLAQGDYRAVIAGLGGRLALPGAYAAARRTRIPFVLWASLWAHPTTLAHRISKRATHGMYRRADAIVTYGPHVTRYVAEQRGNEDDVFEAPQSVDVAHFGQDVTPEQRAEARARAGATDSPSLLLFVGRLEREKGVDLLAEAFAQAGVDATLAFAGTGPIEPDIGETLGQVDKADLPALYAAADALVLPSIRTATFTEPWGLVVNEAMLQATPVITSDAVGAAAGGLVQDGRNGLIVKAGDATALANAIKTLADHPDRARELGRNAQSDVAPYTPQAWADGMQSALRAVGASREDPS